MDRVDRVDRAKKGGLSFANLRGSRDIGEVDRVLQKTTLLGPTCVCVCVCVCMCVCIYVNY